MLHFVKYLALGGLGFSVLGAVVGGLGTQALWAAESADPGNTLDTGGAATEETAPSALKVSDISANLGKLLNETSNKDVKSRITEVQGMLTEDDKKTYKISSYQLRKMNELIGSAEGKDTTLYKLIQNGELGYRGAFIGEVTAYGRLNALAHVLLQAAVLNELGEPTDTADENGVTLWSRLKWTIAQTTDPTLKEALGSADQLQPAIPTPFSKLAQAQTNARALVSLLNPKAIESMAAAINGIREETNKVVTDLSGITGNIDAFCRAVTSLVQGESNPLLTAWKLGDEGESMPARFQETLKSVVGLLENVTDTLAGEVDLAPVVRSLLVTWPMLKERIEATGTENSKEESTTAPSQDEAEAARVQAIQSVYKGKFIQPGLTLMNCLHEVFKVFKIDPLLRIIGRPEAPAEGTFLAQLNKPEASSLVQTKNTLMLLFKLLERTPALGELTDGETILSDILKEAFFGEQNGELSQLDSVEGSVRAALKSCILALPEEVSAPDTTSYWFPYAKIAALLFNEAEVSLPALKNALYATPLIYQIEGIPELSEEDSLLSFLAKKGGGAETDFWERLEGQTLCCVAKAAAHTLANAGEMLAVDVEDTQLGMMKKLSSAIQEAKEKTPPDDCGTLYKNLTSLLKTKVEGISFTEETIADLEEDKEEAFKSKWAALEGALAACEKGLYPLDWNQVYTNLIQSKAALEGKTPGRPTDHYCDVTAFARLNGALFECGAQLFLNLLGQVTDSSSEPTLFGKLRQLEVEVRKAAAGSSEGTFSLEGISEAKQKVSALRGRISYFYERCLPEKEDSTQTEDGALSAQAGEGEGNSQKTVLSSAFQGLFDKLAPMPWLEWKSPEFDYSFLGDCIKIFDESNDDLNIGGGG